MPSAVGLPEPPPWLPPTAFAAINAASAALTAAFDAPSGAIVPPPAPVAGAASAAGSPRTLLDLFPPAVSRDSTAPDLPLREPAAPPPIAAVEPPRVAIKRRSYPAPAPQRAVTYETFYGLDEKPFAAAPDLRFLYHSGQHDRVLQELAASIARRDAVGVLTGDAGIGKTLLCRALADQLDRRTLVSFVAEPPSSAGDLLKTLLVDFGVISREDVAAGQLAAASRADLAGALRDFLGSLAALQATALVIVDDAHRLSSALLAEVRDLSETAAASGLLQIVLVGEPELSRALRAADARALDQKAKVRLVLGPLDEDEIPGYVAHRLAVAGRGERVDFSEPALGRVFSLSRGVPRVVNEICDRSLTLGYQGSASRIDGDFVEEAAQHLGLAAAEAAQTWRDRAIVAAAMLALMLVGAAGAGYVFRDSLGRALALWR